MRRLQSKHSNFDVLKWHKDEIERKKLLKNLQEFKSNEIKVHHVGDIQNATPLERALVLQFEKDSRIQMHGNVASAVEIMTFCDALIVSSVVEGFSLVIAEGLILGLPIFVRNVSGVQWSRNLQGVVFFQDEQELTHKLNEFLDSPWNYSSNNEMQEFEFRFARHFKNVVLPDPVGPVNIVSSPCL